MVHQLPSGRATVLHHWRHFVKESSCYARCTSRKYSSIFLFFLVSINDLPCVTRNTFAVFADDSKYCNVIKRTNGCVSIQDEIGNWNLISANAFHAKKPLSDSIIKLDMKHYALLHDCPGSVVMDTGGCTRHSVCYKKLFLFLITSGNLIFLQLQHHSLQSTKGFAQGFLKDCLQALVVWVDFDVMFTV